MCWGGGGGGGVSSGTRGVKMFLFPEGGLNPYVYITLYQNSCQENENMRHCDSFEGPTFDVIFFFT